MKLRYLVLVTIALVASSFHAKAQCVPMPGTGCAGEPTVLCFGPPSPPCLSPVPSSSCGFTLACAPVFPAVHGCVNPPVILLGFCAPPISIFPIGCDPTCRLGVSPVIGTFADPLNVPPGALPAGMTFCAQCACIARDASGALCVNLGQALGLDVMP